MLCHTPNPWRPKKRLTKRTKSKKSRPDPEPPTRRTCPHNDHIAAQSLDELGVVRVKDSLGHICFVYTVHGRWNSTISGP